VITAAISAAIVAVLSFFGLRPSAVQIGGIVVVVKICVVAAVALIGLRVSRRRRAAAAAQSPEAPVTDASRD
jgi:hypothetical protein